MSFLNEFEKTLAERCHQNEPPFCQAACPFQLDIKDLEDKWKKGRYNAAYRTYQNTVGFPKIVSEICDRPCEKACIRAQVDGAVSLGLLEKATLDFAKRKAPNAYHLPSKGKKIAVIGGGLSGLGCALRLCNKKYEVTLYEKENFLGGHARILMDSEVFDAELQNQFQFEKWERRMGVEVTSLDQIKEEFDAVYVATGNGGEGFGLEPDDGGAFATKTPGIFFGGSLTGAGTMEALADGLEASHAIERYLKTGMMNEPFRRKGTKIRVDAAQIEKKEPVLPADGDRFSQEEAAAEIARCERCSCNACMKACDLMRLREKTPRRLYEEVYITIHPGTLSRDGTWATRLISSCDQCGLCKQVCPQHIDFAEFLAKSMKAMQEKGAMPWPFHDYWLRDMEFSSGRAKVCRRPEGTEKSSYAFFPGCQLAASDPRYVTKTYAWMKEKQPDTAMWMTCCGAPAEWAGDTKLHDSYVENLKAEWKELGEPTVIFACPTCRKMFEQYLPEVPGVFLEEMMEEWGLPEMETVPEGEAAKPGNRSYALFDPCASRQYPSLRNSMQRIADQMGVERVSLPYEGEEARCCSYGGHMSIASPNLSRQMIRDRITKSEAPYLTYCVNCRESFASQGKEAVHFLDLLFGLNGGTREPATVTEKHNNKLAAKKELLKTYWKETMEEEPRMNLIVEKDLEKKLSESQILVQDMEAVVEYCERELRGVVNPENGHITGHLKIQNMTYWAEYEVLADGGYRLWNGYSHRMNLEGE
ncbi:MAG: NAD(P)-binding protein [Clostridium sp.]|nr:NAD(P)-binding protein [Clostridium sp.]